LITIAAHCEELRAAGARLAAPATLKEVDTMRSDIAATRSGSGVVTKLLLLSGIGLLAYPAAKDIYRRWRVKRPVATQEPEIDTALQQTYPASDPPASRYVDIPENRR
jgi:hypothetical protein